MTEPESSRTRQKRAAAMTEPESSRTRPKRAYDVFLSFRGEDTRKNFTDHLYAALVQAGIHTFRDDDELPRGEEISEHLLKAIDESEISIVVFSKGYASSRWCLDELVHILKCKHKIAQVVIPIFYDIDPSDVRKQDGSYAKAFDEHEVRFKEEMEKVDKWRKALEEAGNLSGWGLKNEANGYESEFIKKIVSDVACKLSCKTLHVAERTVGIDSRVQSIISLLENARNDVRIVGIHGIAGIGKTTIAKAVFDSLTIAESAFNSLSFKFEGSCFLDVKEISAIPNGLVELQERLLHGILKPNVWKISNVHEGKNVIKKLLHRIRVFVVLDDVDQKEQLDILMGERSWFGAGSVIIITTKNEDLLQRLEVDGIYPAPELDTDQSLELFSWHAFKGIRPEKDYEELSAKVVYYCQGLPLVLQILGSHLFGRDKADWETDIAQWQKIPHHDIQRKLKVSYDALNEDTREIFLDIACFFVGTEKEYVAKILEARARYEFNPELAFRTLIRRSLITIPSWSNKLSMHDMLRKMGREIIRQMSPKHPGKRNRIWDHKDAYDVLYKKKGTKAVEGLVLDVRDRVSKLEPLSTESFKEMKYLQLLEINGVHLSGCFEFLPKGLIWLCWHGCPLKSWPFDFEWSDLVILDMQYSNIEELWKGTVVLNELKILNLSYCNCLTKTPNFQSMSVEKLMLEGCSSLVDVHQSIGDLKSLVFLNLKGCCKLKNLPRSICNLKSLETLNVSGCSQLEKLPESISVTELLVDEIGNEKFLFSVGQLKNVKKLSLRRYNSIPNSPSSRSWGSLFSSWLSPAVTSFPGWRLLSELKLPSSGLSEGATKRVDFGSMYSLEILDLSSNKFIDLPSGIGRLPKLHTLRVEACFNLLSISELPSSLMELFATDCLSLERVTLPPSQPNNLCLEADGCEIPTIEGMERLGRDHCRVSFFCCFRGGLAEKALSLLVEAMNYEIYFFYDEVLPDWFSCRVSYRIEEQDEFSYEFPLSFRLPPFFHGLALWIVFLGYSDLDFLVVIKNKSNQKKQLFKYEVDGHCLKQLFKYFFLYDHSSWMGYVRREDLAMEEYGGEELELEVGPTGREEYWDMVIEDIGVHAIVEKHDIDNLQERDGIDSGLYYHRLRHPLGGSITCSTKGQWKSYITKEISKTEVAGLVSSRFG